MSTTGARTRGDDARCRARKRRRRARGKGLGGAFASGIYGGLETGGAADHWSPELTLATAAGGNRRRATVKARTIGREGRRGCPEQAYAHPEYEELVGEEWGGRRRRRASSTAAAGGGDETDGGDDSELPGSIPRPRR